MTSKDNAMALLPPDYKKTGKWEDELNSSRRLSALDASRVLGTPQEKRFDDITRIASLVCNAPVAAVNFIGVDRQFLKAEIGLGVRETDLDISICKHALAEDRTLVVENLAQDDRFNTNPLVTAAPAFRFYAGALLKTAKGEVLGTVCVLDTIARPGGLTHEQTEILALLARQVILMLEVDKGDRDVAANVNALARTEARFDAIVNFVDQMIWSTTPTGHHDYYNQRWYEFTGLPEGAADGNGWSGMLHPDDKDMAKARWRQSLDTGEPYQIEYRLRHHTGEFRWVLGRAQCVKDEQGHIIRWYGTCTDIHQTRQAMDLNALLSRELSHRIKNIFAIISSLISLSSRQKPEIKSFADEIRSRIAALGRAHEFVRPHSEDSRPEVQATTLHGMLANLFEAYPAYQRGLILVSGDDVLTDDKGATPLALLFHELVTNAIKYGALANESGKVAIAIAVSENETSIIWKETGGPEIAVPPSTAGFGTRLVEISIVNQLNGRLSREWKPDGLIVTVDIPNTSLSREP